MTASVRRALGVAALLTAAVATGAGAQDGGHALPINAHLYPNGHRLLVLEREGDHRVAARIFTDFGSLVEEPGVLRAARFPDYLMCKGTPTPGTTDWAADEPVIEAFRGVESALIGECNRGRGRAAEIGVPGGGAPRRGRGQYAGGAYRAVRGTSHGELRNRAGR